MSDARHRQTPPGSPDLIADLIRAAGRRESPPAAIHARVKADAMAAFEQTAKSQRLKRWWPAALAASVVALVAVTVLVDLRQPTPAQPIAQLLRVSGKVEAMRPDRQAQWQTLASETSGAFPQGSRLRTAPKSLMALQLSDAVTVRLDSESDITLINQRHIALHAGRIYVDTGDDEGPGLVVTTPAGVARDIGTQFEVRYFDEQLRLRIRDGRVELSRADDQYDVAAGEQLVVQATGALERAAIATDASDWQWIEQIAFAPDIDGRPVRVLLDWVARETGKTLKFSDASVETEVATTLLHGDVSLLRPLQALSVMLATTDFGFAVGDNGEIEVWSKTRQ